MNEQAVARTRAETPPQRSGINNQSHLQGAGGDSDTNGSQPIQQDQLNILDSSLLQDPNSNQLGLSQIRNLDILILKAVEGQLLNNVYVIGQNGAALGRHSASNDIVISESFVSRRHCEIKYIRSDEQTSLQNDNNDNNN